MKTPLLIAIAITVTTKALIAVIEFKAFENLSPEEQSNILKGKANRVPLLSVMIAIAGVATIVCAAPLPDDIAKLFFAGSSTMLASYFIHQLNRRSRFEELGVKTVGNDSN